MCCQNVKNAIRGGNALDFRKAAGTVGFALWVFSR
jgi:hypothetical protein